jgi:DNA-directed RNA polymerase III subunit RPC3
MGMIPGKDAKHLTYKLVDDNYINIKELRKSYAANAQPGKICHVFYVNENQVHIKTSY